MHPIAPDIGQQVSRGFGTVPKVPIGGFAHWVAVGQAMQRLALEATALGLKHAFVNQPVEVAQLRPELAALVGETGLRPDLVIRFGYGPQMPFSLRGPVEAVLA